MAADRSLTANLARYPLFVGGTSALFWIPVTFLFFLDEFGLSEALQLGAIYYLAVVVLEVPSGWFSDRVGRVPTLRLVAVGWLGSFTALALADHFAVAALGQVLQAVGWSFLSGTDVTFHYDSLEALGRDDEFEARESLARRNGMIVRAIAVVSGGALGMIDLRLPFVAGIGVAAYLGVVSLGLHEPPRERVRGSFRRDVASVADRFRVRLLGWLLAYVIAQIILEHLASEFAGPYLAAVLGLSLIHI